MANVLSVVQPLSMTWALAGVVLAVSRDPNEWQPTVGVLMLSQAFCAFYAVKRLRLTTSAVLPDFLTFFLLMQLLQKSLTALGIVVRAKAQSLSVVAQYLSAEELPPSAYMFQAELVFLAATVLFSVVWRVLEGRGPSAPRSEPTPAALWRAYGVALGIHLALASTAAGPSFGMAQEMLRYFSLGAVAVLLGGNSQYGLGRRRSWLPIVALVPLYLIALRSGMKGEVVFVSLPILLPAVRRLDAMRLLVIGAFCLGLVLFVFPFSQAWRLANWGNSSGGVQADIADVGLEVVASWRSDGLLATALESTAQWLTRGSSAEAGGLVMQLADQDGLIGLSPLQGLGTIFVPRFLWPQKPSYAPGAWFTWYLGKAVSPETATSATAMMLPTELYWMAGIPGLACGMVVIAAINFYVWRSLVRRSSQGVVPTVALFSLLVTAPSLEGSAVIYAVSSPIILLVYVAGFDWLQRRQASMMLLGRGRAR